MGRAGAGGRGTSTRFDPCRGTEWLEYQRWLDDNRPTTWAEFRGGRRLTWRQWQNGKRSTSTPSPPTTFAEWLKGDRPSASPAPPPGNGQVGQVHQLVPAGSNPAYITKAVELELDKLRSTPKGERNIALNAAAFNLGRYVGGGELDENDLELELARAAREVGLSESEIIKTMRSGIEAGKQRPRTAPAPTPPSVPPRKPAQPPTPQALAGILRKVTATPDVGLVRWAARKLVEGGYPPPAFDALTQAAHAAGLDDPEITQAIYSARRLAVA